MFRLRSYTALAPVCSAGEPKDRFEQSPYWGVTFYDYLHQIAKSKIRSKEHGDDHWLLQTTRTSH